MSDLQKRVAIFVPTMAGGGAEKSMLRLADGLAGRGFVVADNDISGTGEKAAKATGLNYFLPPDLGSDFNDYHKGAGTFLAGQALRRFMLKR